MELVEELKFPLLPEESKKHLEELGEEDLDILISAYEAISDYRRDLAEAARINDPEKFRQVQDEYNKKFQQLNFDFTGDMEKLQSEDDDEKEKIENVVDSKIDKTVNAFLDEAGQLEDTSSELASKIEISAMTED